MLSWLGSLHLVGLHLAQASSWLAVNKSDTAGAITGQPLTPNGYAFLMMSDPMSIILLALLGIWAVSVELEGLLVVSRILFALSFDRLLPSA